MMQRAGVNHVQIRSVPDLMHPELLNQPENIYLWFSDFGPSSDLFFSSDLNRRLYTEMYLERNLNVLLWFVESSRRHDIKAMLYLCEPQFVPERFPQRHPTVCGPKVDNATCSTRPLYPLNQG
jgi:hypothetical protein